MQSRLSDAADARAELLVDQVRALLSTPEMLAKLALAMLCKDRFQIVLSFDQGGHATGTKVVMTSGR